MNGVCNDKWLFLKISQEFCIFRFCLTDMLYSSLQKSYKVEHIFILR